MNARIVLGVSGGIAAYKAAVLLRLLTEAGMRVRVVPTAAALQFVGAATWEALSGEPVSTEVFSRTEQVDHVRLAAEADLVVIAPATADLLAKVRLGRADDLLTTTVLATEAPVLVAPAMHTAMWTNQATQDNVRALRGRGVHVLDPDVGRLTGKDSGAGRLPEPTDIAAAVYAMLEGERRLAGKKVLITAGGTRERIDAVRFIGNRSSGKQGIHLARAAANYGASVELIGANIDRSVLETLPDTVHLTTVETTAELHAATRAAQASADIIFMAAAVADYRASTTHSDKLKKRQGMPLVLELEENPDILKDLIAHRTTGQYIIGFAAETGLAAETGTALEYAKTKLLAKRPDLLIFNDVSAGQAFDRDENSVNLLRIDNDSQDDRVISVAEFTGLKSDVSQKVVSAVADLLNL